MTLKTAWEKVKKWWKELKRTKKLLVICLGIIGILIIITVAFNFLIPIYNDTLGRSCTTDADCKYVCPGGGAINDRYIDIQTAAHRRWRERHPNAFVDYFCPIVIGSLCEDNRCEEIRIEDLTSPEICERFSSTEERSCYWSLAFNLENASYCDYFQEDSAREGCIEQATVKQP